MSYVATPDLRSLVRSFASGSAGALQRSNTRPCNPARWAPSASSQRPTGIVGNVSLILQILVGYVVTSVAVGLPLGIALGRRIHHAERCHRQHIAMLMSSRALHGVGSSRAESG